MVSKDSNESIENAKMQLASYGNQIQSFLSGVKADIQQYKFLVEKKGNGLNVDIEFKATISAEQQPDDEEDTSSGVSRP